MSSAMFQFAWAGPVPTADDVAGRFGLDQSEIDHGYGVVLVDAHAGLYVVRIDVTGTEVARIRATLTAEQRAAGAEVFADPGIDPTDH